MFERFAIYYAPEGDLAVAGAAWLGWDLARGAARAHPEISGIDLAALTRRPRKYGMHGTVKPPFVLAEGFDLPALGAAFEQMCAGLPVVPLGRLELRWLGHILAFVPVEESEPLRDLAAQVVRGLDRFRAAPSQDELARRRARGLSAVQERNLQDWGYPDVMEAFRFHITLSGPVRRDRDAVYGAAAAYFAPFLGGSFQARSLTLVGQDGDGMFHQIQRCGLTGAG